MRLVLATNHLGLGGSESYLLTVAEQFDRLGHETVIYSPELGAGTDVARERALAVVSNVADLPDGCEAVLVQDAGCSHELAERYSSTPQLFVAHGEFFDLVTPPQLDRLVGAIVVLNDRVGARMRNLAVEVEVIRLRQPIDTERFTSRSPLPEVPRRALFLSNTPSSDRLNILKSACDAASLELVRLGAQVGQTTDPRSALVDADIVIGYGRSILEAMACGRAAYVYDWKGGEGWVTADSYSEIEADGFGGRSGRMIVDPEVLAEDLRGYATSMGPVNHDLVSAHHRANVHAQQLVEILKRLGAASGRPREGLQEMARLVRLEWRARGEVFALSAENAALRELLKKSQESAEEELARSQEAIQEEKLSHGNQVEARVRHAYESTFSWRLTSPLRRVWRLLRRR